MSESKNNVQNREQHLKYPKIIKRRLRNGLMSKIGKFQVNQDLKR